MKPKSKNRILQGAREALAFAGGKANLREYRIHVPAGVDVAKLRRKLHLSQSEFAQQVGAETAILLRKLYQNCRGYGFHKVSRRNLYAIRNLRSRDKAGI